MDVRFEIEIIIPIDHWIFPSWGIFGAHQLRLFSYFAQLVPNKEIDRGHFLLIYLSWTQIFAPSVRVTCEKCTETTIGWIRKLQPHTGVLSTFTINVNNLLRQLSVKSENFNHMLKRWAHLKLFFGAVATVRNQYCGYWNRLVRYAFITKGPSKA